MKDETNDMIGLMTTDSRQHWNASGYARHARFVVDLARRLIGMLGSKPGETILDLGCGDGFLIAEIYRFAAKIIEIDRAEAMAEAVLSE